MSSQCQQLNDSRNMDALKTRDSKLYQQAVCPSARFALDFDGTFNVGRI
jgi:hypothetical protein